MGKRSRSPAPPTYHVGVVEAVRMGVDFHRRGMLDAAQTLYERVLKLVPDDADANHFYGVLLSQRGQHKRAWPHIERSLELNDKVPDWYGNAGNVLLELGQLEAAAQAYGRCAELAPNQPEVHNNLGVLQRAEGRLDEAEASYRRALELNPEFVDAHANLGQLLTSQGKAMESLACYARALELRPKDSRTRRILGFAYFTLGQLDKAADVYRQWLAEEPDNAQAQHHLAACTGQAVPQRASDEYVEATFDGFANSFDSKLAVLHYRAPELVGEAVKRHLGEPAKSLSVLDAGCGTGLCGPLLAPYAGRLDGVDLSGGMLEKARPRQVYEALHKAELTEFIQRAAGTYDLIVSADTLCYFGDLGTVMPAARAALTPLGWLVFTVEAWLDQPGPEGFHLNPHGRYSHSADYVKKALNDAGFELIELTQDVLRKENMQPVHGWIVVARAKPAA